MTMKTTPSFCTGLLWLSIAGLWLAPASTLSAQASPAPKPNVLVILTDDQGRGDYSAFGTREIHTPNMDRLFHDGMTFQNFFANSCVCSPSRAALLTGCYPDRVGVPGVIRDETPDNSWGYLLPGARLLPQLLKQAGCHTALIGTSLCAATRCCCTHVDSCVPDCCCF